MSPTAQSATPASAIEGVASRELLDSGEEIILAIKPSLWFVPLSAAPVIVTAVLVAGTSMALDRWAGSAMPSQWICLCCLAIALARLVIASGQYVGRLYLLTSRRVLTIRGVMRVSLTECPLREIHETDLTAAPIQKMLRLGDLAFLSADGARVAVDWECLAQPDDVQQAVLKAIRRAK